MRAEVHIRLKGGMLEKLIQKALDEGAAFACLSRSGARGMTVSCDQRSADILLQLSRRYKIDARVLRFGGKTALLRRIRRRWTLIPAMALAAAMMLLFFSRIWYIDLAFTGAEAHSVDADALLALLAESGVKPGIASAGLDTGALEKQLLASAGTYSYIGLKVQGVRLLVEAAPETASPDLYDIGRARDLVASRDGVIERVSVYSGAACVNAGDTVRRGQLLIRGEEQKSKEDVCAVSALGSVYARCWFEGSACAPRTQTVCRRTGRSRKERSLSLFSRKLPLGKCTAYETEVCETRILPLIGLYLPVEIIETTHYETETSQAVRDQSELLSELEALARADALSKIDIPSGQFSIRESWLETEINDHTIGVRAVYEISTDIAAGRDELAKEDY